MKPHIHAENSVKKYGGKPEDYIRIHEWFDDTKSHIADHRHRALKHHSQGIFEAEKVFGSTLVNSDDKIVSVRDVGEDHVFEDLGFIPTVQDYMRNMNLQPWMSGSLKTSIFKSPSMNEYIDGSSLPQPVFTPATDKLTANYMDGTYLPERMQFASD